MRGVARGKRRTRGGEEAVERKKNSFLLPHPRRRLRNLLTTKSPQSSSAPGERHLLKLLFSLFSLFFSLLSSLFSLLFLLSVRLSHEKKKRKKKKRIRLGRRERERERALWSRWLVRTRRGHAERRCSQDDSSTLSGDRARGPDLRLSWLRRNKGNREARAAFTSK